MAAATEEVTFLIERKSYRTFKNDRFKGSNKSKEKITNVSAYQTAGLLSRFFLWWFNGFMWYSTKERSLQLDDLPVLPKEFAADHQRRSAKREWKNLKGKRSSRPSLTRLLIRLHGCSFVTGGLCAFCMGMIRIVQNILVGYFLILDVRNSNFKLEVYLIAAGIAVLSMAEALLIHQWTISLRCVGLRARITCAILSYKRILRWNRSRANQTSTGSVINLFGNDMNVFDERIRFLPMVFIAPIELLANLGVMWWLIGWYAAVGISFLLVCLCFQVAMGNAFAALRRKAHVLTGERIQLTTDVLNGIKLIKMYAWEFPMGTLIKAIRSAEMSYVTRSMALRAVMTSIFNVTGRMTFFCIILPYILCGNRLKPELVFTMTTFCYVLRAVAGYLFQSGVVVAAETCVSLKRINNFLADGEKMKSNSDPKKWGERTGAEIVVKNLMCDWKQSSMPDVAGSVSFTARPGEIVAVVGAVGAGKTTLLMALMGELKTSKQDAVTTVGTVAYVPQEPWVFAGTIVENVLFGSPLDETRYRKAVEVCALTEDLKNFPEGRETIVGEKGTMLSGGQKARISLARAVYADADIYLLDDPLSAVDSKVSKYLFEECIRKHLRKKIVVMATHQVQYLDRVDFIVLLNKCVCTGQGSYLDLMDAGVHFPHTAAKSSDEEDPSESECDETKTDVSTGHSHQNVTSIKADPEESQAVTAVAAESNSKDFAASGFVSWRIHWEYMTKDSNVALFLLLVCFVVLFQGLGVGVDYWLKYWVEQENAGRRSVSQVSIEVGHLSVAMQNLTNATGLADSFGFSAGRRFWFLYSYMGLLFGSLAATLIALVIASLVCRMASVGYHSRLLTSVLRAKPHFFDVLPIGNFQNRFSVDMADVDYNLPMSLFDVMVMSGGCVAPLVLLCVLNYWLIIPSLLLVIFYCKMTVAHLQACGNLKRLEGVGRSPLFSHVTNTVLGLPVIHAMHKEDVMLAAFEDHLNRFSSAVYHYICANCWVTSKIQMADSFFVAAVIFVMAYFFEDLSRETIGLVMTLSFMLMPLLWWNIIRIGEAEDQMTAIERIKHYVHLESEAPLDSNPDVKPPDSWPAKGSITMDNVQAVYPLANKVALDGLSFHIKSGEKVGIVGRTGAGKSSLVTTIFRLMEPIGPVVIDGIQINNIGLHDLRKQLSVIPQEPIMFAGSVRANLDPFSEHSTEELMAALDDVGMKNSVCSMEGGLEANVGEGGCCFSAGERQLLCITRAIIRHNKILILDEATAKIDNRMDALIQSTIRRNFGDCTVLTVAHRLSTIMDYDRVMVLDKGVIVEFDEPYLLLQKGELGHFYGLVQSGGSKSESVLRKLAKDAHDARAGGRHVQFDLIAK